MSQPYSRQVRHQTNGFDTCRCGYIAELFDSILTQYKLCLNFFGLEDTGQILVRGCKDKGDVTNTETLQQAYELGENL